MKEGEVEVAAGEEAEAVASLQERTCQTHLFQNPDHMTW